LKMVASLSAISPVSSPRPSSRASSSRLNDVPLEKMSQSVPGLGSSSTLISYIKSTKTGDDPLPPSTVAPYDGQTNLDRVERSGQKPSTSELPVASSQPLKHVRFSGNN
jgi:hypothetical protein